MAQPDQIWSQFGPRDAHAGLSLIGMISEHARSRTRIRMMQQIQEALIRDVGVCLQIDSKTCNEMGLRMLGKLIYGRRCVACCSSIRSLGTNKTKG
jgi:hypothetical protein